MKVDETEKQTLKWLANEQRVSVADLIRSTLLVLPIDSLNRTTVVKQKPKREVVKVADPDLIYEINAIGNNLNQSSRRLSEGDKFDAVMELRSIELMLERVLNAYQIP